MPYWTPATVGERLAQLIEDVNRVAGAAAQLDAATGGSVGLPEGEFGHWRDFAKYLNQPLQVPPSVLDVLKAHQLRLPHADDSDLGEAYSDVQAVYLLMHRTITLATSWLESHAEHETEAEALRSQLGLAEDEAHRVLSGYGDLRRNRRRGL